MRGRIPRTPLDHSWTIPIAQADNFMENPRRNVVAGYCAGGSPPATVVNLNKYLDLSAQNYYGEKRFDAKTVQLSGTKPG